MNSCGICHNKFDDANLLQSKDDEYFCKECFKCQYCTAKPKKKSPKNSLQTCRGDSLLIRPRKMFPIADLLAMKEDKNAITKLVAITKRPLRCPHGDCNRFVSIGDVIAHFQHEHIDVPIIQTIPDSRNPLLFYPKDIRYGANQCVALLNVILPPEEPPANANTLTPAATNERSLGVTLAILASRIAAAQLEEESDCVIEDEDSKGFVGGTNDKIAVWAASNIGTHYTYTIAVSTVNEDVRIKYFGPLLQLGKSAGTLGVQGHCLVLSNYHFVGMSENGTKPVQLDVIMHLED